MLVPRTSKEQALMTGRDQKTGASLALKGIGALQ
jgi:hypothetical protein